MPYQTAPVEIIALAVKKNDLSLQVLKETKKIEQTRLDSLLFEQQNSVINKQVPDEMVWVPAHGVSTISCDSKYSNTHISPKIKSILMLE